MEESILQSTKKVLGIHPDDDSFDLDVMTHINSAFSILHQLGVGPVDGFFIEDEGPTWTDFVNEPLPIMNEVKTCVYLRVRMLFDPPTTSFLINSMERQIVEHEWRLSVMREGTPGDQWVPPLPPVVIGDE